MRHTKRVRDDERSRPRGGGRVNLTVDDDAIARDVATGDGIRVATARSRVTMSEPTARLVESNALKKGDVLGAARYAAVQAAKSAGAYLPLYTPLSAPLAHVTFEVGEDFVDVRVDVLGQGLEGRMPALSAATVAALTIFDMCKAVDRTMSIGHVECVDVEESGNE